jgi:hypothetical protein
VVEVAAELPARADVIVANELLDNLPVRIVERTAEGWAEVWVPDQLRPTDLHLDVDVGVGTRLPVFAAATAWVDDARRRAGRVVAFDYGVRTTAELADRTWLRTYTAHGRGTDPYAPAGSVDVTVDVAFDQLPAPGSIATQADRLRAWGIDDLVEAGRRIWTERAHLGDLAAVRGRSRVREAEALLDPAGLGAFLVADWPTTAATTTTSGSVLRAAPDPGPLAEQNGTRRGGRRTARRRRSAAARRPWPRRAGPPRPAPLARRRPRRPSTSPAGRRPPTSHAVHGRPPRRTAGRPRAT